MSDLIDIREIKEGQYLKLTPYGARWFAIKVTNNLVVLGGSPSGKTKYLLRNEARQVYLVDEVKRIEWEF